MSILPSRYATRVGWCAVLLHLTISGMLLSLLGDPYISDGGSPLLKIHPASYLAYGAGLLTILVAMMRRGRQWPWIWTQRQLVVSIACLAGCGVFEAIFTGAGNPIVLVDTFLPACMLAVAFADASPQDMNALRKLVLAGFALNALIALGEATIQAHIIPALPDFPTDFDKDEEFRSTALYDHPLTGAAASVMGLLMARSIAAPVLRTIYMVIMLGAVIAFGGRVALVTATAALLWHRGSAVLSAILYRRRSALWLLVASGTGCVLCTLGISLAVAAGFGTRLQNHLYWDPSAQIRLAQWQIVGLLDPNEILFGATRTNFLRHVHMLFLSDGVQVIECFWLLLFTSLGVFGFPLFLAGFGGLLGWCWRRSAGQGRAMVATVLLMTSTSNSLGRKSPLLLLMAASVSSLPMRHVSRSRKEIAHA